MHQETRKIFWNFCKKNKAHRGSDSKNRGVYSKNTRKIEKESKAHRYKAQNPRSWWIRILQMPQGRWIDPDPLKPRSNGQGFKKLERVLTDAV